MRGLPLWLRWWRIHVHTGDLGLILESGRSPGERSGYSFQYSCLENSMDRGAWWTTVQVRCEICDVIWDPIQPEQSLFKFAESCWLRFCRQKRQTHTISLRKNFCPVSSFYPKPLHFNLLTFSFLGSWPPAKPFATAQDAMYNLTQDIFPPNLVDSHWKGTFVSLLLDTLLFFFFGFFFHLFILVGG